MYYVITLVFNTSIDAKCFYSKRIQAVKYEKDGREDISVKQLKLKIKIIYNAIKNF